MRCRVGRVVDIDLRLRAERRAPDVFLQPGSQFVLPAIALPAMPWRIFLMVYGVPDRLRQNISSRRGQHRGGQDGVVERSHAPADPHDRAGLLPPRRPQRLDIRASVRRAVHAAPRVHGQREQQFVEQSRGGGCQLAVGGELHNGHQRQRVELVNRSRPPHGRPGRMIVTVSVIVPP